eukprot:gene10146-biopygen9377
MRPWRTSPPRAAHVAGPSDERAQYVGQAGLSKPRGLAGVAHALLDKTQREGAVFAGQDSAGSSRLSAVGDHAGDLARQSLCRAERFNAGLPKAQAHPRSTRPPFPSPRMEQVVRPSWHSAALLASHAAFAAAALGRRAEARRQLGCGSCGLNRGHAGGPANLLNLPHSGHLKMPGLRKVGEGVSGTDAAPVSAHDPSHESLTLGVPQPVQTRRRGAAQAARAKAAGGGEGAEGESRAPSPSRACRLSEDVERLEHFPALLRKREQQSRGMSARRHGMRDSVASGSCGRAAASTPSRSRRPPAPGAAFAAANAAAATASQPSPQSPAGAHKAPKIACGRLANPAPERPRQTEASRAAAQDRPQQPNIARSSPRPPAAPDRPQQPKFARSTRSPQQPSIACPTPAARRVREAAPRVPARPLVERAGAAAGARAAEPRRGDRRGPRL